MRVLLPVDGSRFTSRMIEFVVAHPPLLGAHADATLLSVYDDVLPREAAYHSRNELLASRRSEAESILAKARTALQPAGVEWRESALAGEPGPEIVRYAEENGVDLIVMGSHGHTALASVLLGSVTTWVISHSKIPVLVVR